MSPVTQLESASGLRPASAFFFIAAVLTLAAAWVGAAALGADLPERNWQQTEKEPPPAYRIADQDGRPMAVFVQRLDLVMSPNAMWQAHTPRTIAEGVAAVLGPEVDPRALLAKMLPDAVHGVITTTLPLDPTQAVRIQRWIETGSPEGDGAEPRLEGLWLARGESGPVLCWLPEVVLDESVRSRQGERFSGNPLKWGRYLADGLALAMMGEDALAAGADEIELEEQRAAIWRWLCPSTWCVPVRGFDAARAPALLEFLNGQHVAYHQMRIERGRDRRYPSGKFEILGSWNYVGRGEAAERAALALRESVEGAASATANAALEDNLVDDERDRAAATWELLAQPLPVSGLERACDRLLGDRARFGFLQVDPASYSFRRHRSVRAKQTRSYFLESVAPGEPPQVATTFDVMLQRQVGLALDDLMERHRPALAMAIALDLASGSVLAVDTRSEYPISGFAPLYHEFTPGSTFKVIVMACALESGAVTPGQIFDVGLDRAYPFGPRVIHEAESSATGVLTASQCLAHSVNAGMVQIGTRVPDAFLHGHILGLGYGRAPHAELGGERDGYVRELPWHRNWTHASVSFGHELKVTLWQHAAGLAAICRGGQWLPLRVLDAVTQGGERYELPRAEPRRVFTEETCATVREMMQLGAREGTGKVVASPERLPGLVVGTKTGTAQKVGGEVCIHVELADQVAHHRSGTSCSGACRNSLKTRERDHRNCYTSSMCIWGRVEGTDREVMVLVVADEPRGREKYGSRVAGETAVRILEEALGRTRNGERVVADLAPGFAASEAEPLESWQQPWAEAAW